MEYLTDRGYSINVLIEACCSVAKHNTVAFRYGVAMAISRCFPYLLLAWDLHYLGYVIITFLGGMS